MESGVLLYAVGGIFADSIRGSCLYRHRSGVVIVRQLCQMSKSNQRAMESGNLYSRIRRKWKNMVVYWKVDLWVPALAKRVIGLHTRTLVHFQTCTGGWVRWHTGGWESDVWRWGLKPWLAVLRRYDLAYGINCYFKVHWIGVKQFIFIFSSYLNIFLYLLSKCGIHSGEWQSRIYTFKIKLKCIVTSDRFIQGQIRKKEMEELHVSIMTDMIRD